jgi:hypothetical protein
MTGEGFRRDAGGGGSGSVTDVESTDNSVIVTNPAGPTVDLTGVLPISDLTENPTVGTFTDPITGHTCRVVYIFPVGGPGGLAALATSSQSLPAALLPDFILYADGEMDWRNSNATPGIGPANVSTAADGAPFPNTGTALQFFGSSGSGMIFGGFDPNGNEPYYAIAAVGGPIGVSTSGGVGAFNIWFGDPNGNIGGNLGDIIWDATDCQWWFCTTAGTTGTALFHTNPFTSGSLATTTLTTGTAAQIDTVREVETHTSVTFNPSGAVAATCRVELSPDNTTFTTLCVWTEPSSASLVGTIHDVSVRVPAGWWLRLTGNALARVSIGTTTYY